MWVRNTQCIPPSRLVKMYLWPRDEIHCAYCGNYPGNGIISLVRDLGCCTYQPRVQAKQKRLDAEFSTTIDSQSKPAFWLARSTGQTQTSVAVSNATACEPDVANTVQTDLRHFCGQ